MMTRLLITLLLFAATPLQAQTNNWYVVLFVVDGCHFCEMMRDRVIKPMITTGELSERRFYEINMTDKGEWFYFDPMNAYLQKRDLYKQYDLGLFPTTVILDDQANMLVKLVGITTGEKFSRQLKDAMRRMDSHAAP